jgi:hypothetical protein
MTDKTLQAGHTTLRYLADTYFNLHAIITLVLCVGVALLLGRFIAFVLRKIVNGIGASADRSQNLGTVNRLRRYETMIVLSIFGGWSITLTASRQL